MKLEELKQKYNELLKREIKAERWMNAAPQKDIDKWMPNYINITKKLSQLMNEYENITGNKMNDKEVFKGFDL